MILGVDPGKATCGWAVVHPATAIPVALGFIRTTETSLPESADDVQRIAQQNSTLRAIAKQYGVNAICAEARSLGGHPKARLQMAISLCLSWGALASLANELGAALFEVPPKTWQHEVVTGMGKKVDYVRVFRELKRYANKHRPVDVALIAKGDLNHALDGMGVAMFGALCRDKATRIGAAA